MSPDSQILENLQCISFLIKAFMIWKFPGRLPPLENVHDLNKELMEQVSRESLKSTYQVDYIGVTQGKAFYNFLKHFT